MMEHELRKEELKKEFVKTALEEYRDFWGVDDEKYISELADIFIDDDVNHDGCWGFLEKSPYAREMEVELGRGKILDFGCGWGTFILYGLKKGYDVFGIDVSRRRKNFYITRIEKMGYPEEWKSRYILACGEALPFRDSSFDVVVANQTMEHVKDPFLCLREIYRVLKKGGVFYMRSPDYRSFYEPHYRMLWFPFLGRGTVGRKIARFYLGFFNRPEKGLEFVNFITTPEVIRGLKEAGFGKIVDVERVHVFEGRKKKIAELIGFLPRPIPEKLASLINPAYEVFRQLRKIGREENVIHIIAKK